MAETLEKLRPDRDLQCYFERPSAIAAMSEASPSGFTISGTWRQQFDWVVVEWTRDNVFEHPLFRNLPDGDLSGLRLSYQEQRENCIPLDSSLYPTVDWPYLRIWAEENGQEQLYRVRIADYAVPVEGEYAAATALFELGGWATAGDYVGLAWPGEHHTYLIGASDTLETAAQAIVDSINAFSAQVSAVRQGTQVRLTYRGGAAGENRTGHNGNRFGAYGYASGAKTEQWSPWWRRFEGGVSPTVWKVELDFGNLLDIEGRRVPTAAVRKMRWTWAADWQPGEFVRSEFRVRVSGWTVTGTGRGYRVAGAGSRRIEDDSPAVAYTGTWSEEEGNYSGGSIRKSTTPGSSVTIEIETAEAASLYVGGRITPDGGVAGLYVGGQQRGVFDCRRAGEDTLVRIPLGGVPAGQHRVEVRHMGESGSAVWFDFLEIAKPAPELPSLRRQPVLALATDWDTDHSLAIAPERTAWMIQSLGFGGRVNHYVGAMWFYELQRRGHAYASATVEFQGAPAPNAVVEIAVGRVGRPESERTVLTHLVHAGDTAETVARAFEIQIQSGYTGIRAEAEGNVLRIISRSMGADGNLTTVSGSPAEGDFRVVTPGATLAGGVDGVWCTDTAAPVRINRAARDWSQAFFRALKGYGLDVVCAFSMELQHGDGSLEAGMAQRYPSGNPVWLNTPALQTNFSPASVAYWKEVYRGMAMLMAEAGVAPYLQFGEVQWWYFPYDGSGMPLWDDYTRMRFEQRHGRAMRAVPNQFADLAEYGDEAALARDLIGEFTDAVIEHVLASAPGCRFEVLYPTDVNETPFNRAMNFPPAHWTASKLANLKTESFTYTLERNLTKSKGSLEFGRELGFVESNRSHLVGLSGARTAWEKEARLALEAKMESVVLFALDQTCLIGHRLPVREAPVRAFQVE